MTNKKKTLYEILEVSPDASYSEIQAAYQRVSQKLQSEKTVSNREEIDYRLLMLDVALHALAYDARLVKQNEPANVAVQRNAVVAPLDFDAGSLKSDAASLKADAMSYKADAMSLKAEALSLKADGLQLSLAPAPIKTAATPLMPPKTVATPYKLPAAINNDLLPIAIVTSTLTSSATVLKIILRTIAGLMVLGVVLKISFNIMSSRGVQVPVQVPTASIDEKTYIQEYYQTHGVRVASKAEADRLDAEENQQREGARQKQKQDDEYRRFVEDSRREGEKVSENLRRDEQNAREEEWNKQQQLAQEKRDAERERIEENRRDVEEARRRLGLNN
jgi:hypothetical protein